MGVGSWIFGGVGLDAINVLVMAGFRIIANRHPKPTVQLLYISKTHRMLGVSTSPPTGLTPSTSDIAWGMTHTDIH